MKKSLFVFSAAITFVALSSSPVLMAQNTAPYWSLAGNNNASPGSKLGTTNNISLRFYTNNVQRMIINSIPAQGFVGIGTATPTERLHVNSASGANAFRAQVNASTKLLVHSGGGVTIGAGSTPPSNGLFVNGNTGLGTTSPSRKLHVVGTSLFTANLNVSDGGLSATNTFGDGISGIGSVRGVYGFGTSYGVHGVGSGSTAYGLYGDGYIGVYATSSLASGDGVRTFAYGSSAYGVNAYSSASIGVYGVTANSGSYGGYFVGNVYSTGLYQGSDRTLKQDITDMTSAMDLIKKLQPKSYTFRQDGNYKLMNLPAGKHYGLIAQDIEQVLPDLVKATTFETGKSVKPPGISPSETIEFKALNYIGLIPIVVKGMQELDAENKEKDKRITNLEAELADLRKIVMDLKNSGAGSNMVTSTSAFLKQNIPNPVAGNTTICYQVPVTATSAKVIINNAKGQEIKTLMISNKGAGQVSFNSATLAAGTYYYSLWVESKQVDTKRLIIAR